MINTLSRILPTALLAALLAVPALAQEAQQARPQHSGGLKIGYSGR